MSGGGIDYDVADEVGEGGRGDGKDRGDDPMGSVVRSFPEAFFVR